jgi:hypothetical protein
MIRRRPVGAGDTVARGKSWFLGAYAIKKVINGRAESFFAMHPLQSFDQGMLFADGAIAIAEAYVRDVNGNPTYRAADFAIWPPAAPSFLSRSLLVVSRASICVARTDQHEEERVVRYRLSAALRSHALTKSQSNCNALELA